MSEYIEVGQPLQFTDPNTPTRVGEIVENVSDIYNIPSPRLGMQVFVKSEKKSFVITKLKSKVIGGVDVPEAAVEAFEAVGAKSIAWNNDTDLSNMNDFFVAGVYDIKGEHTRIDDNLPILNTGGGHSFNARLTVLDSSISGSREGDDKCITQVLSFSNRLGQGEVYIRTGKGSSLDNLTWEDWSTLQRNVNVGAVTSLDDLVDNGIYSGVYVKNDAVLETFVLVVINNYALAGNNIPKSISQFKYSVNLGGSFAKYKTRVGTGVNDWGEWKILNNDEISSMISAEIKKVTDGIDPNKIDSIKDIVAWIEAHGGDVTAIYNAIQGNTTRITEEERRAAEAEGKIKSRAVDADSLNVAQEIDGVRIDFATLDDDAHSGDIIIPAATTESAGVMSAEDKKTLGVDHVAVKNFFKNTYTDIDFYLNSATQDVGVLVENVNGIAGFRVVGIASDGNVEYVSKATSKVGQWFFFKLEKQHTMLRVIFSDSYITEDTIATITVKECNNLSLAVAQNNIAIKEIENAVAEQAEAVNKNKMDIAENKVVINGLEERVYKQGDVLVDTIATIKSGTTLTKDTTLVTEIGEYVIKVDNVSANVSSFRLVGYKVAGGTVTLLAHKQVIGEYIPFQLSEPMTKLRVVIEPTYVTEAGNISVVIRTPSYDIQEDLNTVKEDVEKNRQEIEAIKAQTNDVDILFPVPSDIYCAVGTDMNLYYENMFGMLLGSGYMFIDSPDSVYDTSMDESGGYDRALNLERQYHFKPNKAGTMALYLNVWNDYMQQVGARSTLLHIVDPVAANGKTVNMLVNGSSSIDIGFFQAEIKQLLETAGATVNMVGRWASGYVDDPRDDVRYDVQNRLSENRSGGASYLYTTKANSGKTVIVHPTNLTGQFYQYDAVLRDNAGNTWEVWGNSADFCELVLKSGSASTIPASGTLTKISGKGVESFAYDRLITDVPQTTNPFWSDTRNGISFTEYCSNWNRPTPNVFVTLWGTNDINGTNDNLGTGKQWATDEQIKTFVDRQKILVDAYTRDCPNGVVIMCPQPTGSSLTGKKNSDKNGMLFSKLKATQALMDAFADYDNVIIVPVLWWFDRKYSYIAKDVTMSERMADHYGDKHLDVVTDDSTHPQARGYFQMADAAYSAIVYWLNEK